MNTFSLTHLKGPQGDDNTPGLLGYVLVAREDAFSKIAKAPKTGTTAGETAIITDNHTFTNADDGFAKVYLTLDSNMLKAAITGERDGRGLKISFEGFHPGNNAEALEFMRIVKNLGLIILVPDADGTYLQVGAEGLPVEFAPDYDSGKLSSGRRGFTVKGEAYANGMYIYAGTVKYKA
ncbi:hypothetical protein GO988_15490 [Hymenobacter sp. HMF4947]|uniref:Uncharacterized protein n=1 Tax=Hymenobacter ginkgonis TaxID=2682976 RepID=A0A7K1THG3_9BACT|nr:hypothetical protein [Hymenobacter ginkgonis]MVN77736.1 hypothetical protein [Hymenobacter ginkgonis]